jgi:UTP--glucose-1-phosphate uridylyltransferase
MKIDEAVIILGGMGTRLLPLTKTVPKEMLPIYDVPAILLLVEEAYKSGIKKIIFVVTKHNKKIIESFFTDDTYLNNFLKDKPDKQKLLKRVNDIIKNMEFKYVYQTIKGSYGALYSAKKFIKNDNFILMYGDDLVDSNIPLTKLLIDNFNKDNKMYVAVKEKKIDELPNVGIVKLDKDNNLIDLVKKDKDHSSCELHGRMLLNKKIFTVKNKLHKHSNDEYYLPYALLLFPKEVKGLKYSGNYFNLGEKTGYIKASIHYALKDNNNNNLIKYIKEVL